MTSNEKFKMKTKIERDRERETDLFLVRWRSSVENVFDLDAEVSKIEPCIGKK
jgi:hypothetical protein